MPDIDEIKSIMHETANNIDTKLSEEEQDAYDQIIEKIILIEKTHKYGTTEEKSKFKQIESLIQDFIKSNDDEANGGKT